MMPRIYVPHAVRLPSGRVVRVGAYDAETKAERDGQSYALVHVNTFGLDATLEVYNDELKERWKRPPGGARVSLLPYHYQMSGEPIEHPIDATL